MDHSQRLLPLPLYGANPPVLDLPYAWMNTEHLRWPPAQIYPPFLLDPKTRAGEAVWASLIETEVS